RVDSRRLHLLVAVGRQMVGAQRVDRDDDDRTAERRRGAGVAPPADGGESGTPRGEEDDEGDAKRAAHAGAWCCVLGARCCAWCRVPGAVPGAVVPGAVVPGAVVPGAAVPGAVVPGAVARVRWILARSTAPRTAPRTQHPAPHPTPST